jgi:hypothetical protein
MQAVRQSDRIVRSVAARHFRNDRTAMLAMVGTLELEATSAVGAPNAASTAALRGHSSARRGLLSVVKSKA